MEHTPGPWKYGVRKDGSMWISMGDPVRRHSQFDWLGFEGDARLAMAAPELLEALKEMREHAEYSNQYGEAAFRKSEAVIAKAEGKA